MQGLRKYHIPCAGTLIWWQQGHPTDHPDLLPQTQVCSREPSHASGAEVLGSNRIAISLEMCHFPAKLVQNGARMSNGAYAAPLPCMFFTQPDYLLHLYTSCMVGAGNGARAFELKSKSATLLGGSNGVNNCLYNLHCI